MQQVLYRSKASARTPSDEIFRIISTSSRKNGERGITGFLIYANDEFLQLIEGDAPTIDALMMDLRNDPRHHSLEVLSREEIRERSFPKWRMERLAVTSNNVTELVGRLQEAGISEAVRGRVESFFVPSKAA